MKGTEQGKEAERKKEKKQSEEQSRGEKRKKETSGEQIENAADKKGNETNMDMYLFLFSLRAFLYLLIAQSTHSLWHISITSFNLLPLLFPPPFIFFCLYIGVVPPHSRSAVNEPSSRSSPRTLISPSITHEKREDFEGTSIASSPGEK